MTDHSAMKLGKLAPRADERNLKLARYLDLEQLPTAPEQTTRLMSSDVFPMFLNDQLGDCTCAAVAHMQQVWGYLSGAAEQFTNDDVLALYEAVGGYRPGDPSSDGGAAEIDVLNYWRRTGITSSSGRKTIAAYAQVNVEDTVMVKTAAWLFDGLYIGVALPITAQSQDVWDVDASAGADAEPGSWGGHAVNVVDYDATGLTVITWGASKQMTWEFWHAYVDEAYATLSPDDFDSRGLSVEGFASDTLQSDLQIVTRDRLSL